MTDVPRRINSSSSRLRRSKNEILRSTLGMYLKQRNYTASVRYRKTDLKLTHNQRQAELSMMLDDDMSRVNSILYSNVMCLNKNAAVVEQQLDQFLQFVRGQPDNIRSDLQAFVCPLICHLFVELLKGKDPQPAHDFLRKFAHLFGSLLEQNGIRSDNVVNGFSRNLQSNRSSKVPGSASPSLSTNSTSSQSHMKGFTDSVPNFTNGINHDDSNESKPSPTRNPTASASTKTPDVPPHAIVFEVDAESASTTDVHFARLAEALSLCNRPEDVDAIEMTRLFRYTQHEIRVRWATVLALKRHFIACGHVMIMHTMQSWFAFDIADGGEGVSGNLWNCITGSESHCRSMVTRSAKKKTAMTAANATVKPAKTETLKNSAVTGSKRTIQESTKTVNEPGKKVSSKPRSKELSSTSTTTSENNPSTTNAKPSVLSANSFTTSRSSKTLNTIGEPSTTTKHQLNTSRQSAKKRECITNQKSPTSAPGEIESSDTMPADAMSPTAVATKSQTSLIAKRKQNTSKLKTARIANKLIQNVATRRKTLQLHKLLKLRRTQRSKRSSSKMPKHEQNSSDPPSVREPGEKIAQPNAVRDRMVLRHLRWSILKTRTIERPIRVFTLNNSQRVFTSADVDTQQCHIVCGFEDSTVRLWPLNQSSYGGRKPYASFTSRLCSWNAAHDINDLSSDDFAEEDEDDDDAVGLGRRVRHKRNATGSIRSDFVSTAASDDFCESNTCVEYILRGHSAGITAVRFSRHQPRLLYSVSKDREMRAWLPSGCAAVYRGHNYAIWCLTENPAVPYLATGSRDLTARLWCSEREFPLQTYVGHTQDVDAVAFHPNGNYLATGSTDLTVRLWCVTSGKLFRIFNNSQRPVQCIAFSPDGKFLAAAGEEKVLRIFDLAAGAQLAELPGHTAPVTSVAWSKTGDRLVSGCADGTIRTFAVQHLTMQSVVVAAGAAAGAASTPVSTGQPRARDHTTSASVGSNFPPSGVIDSGCRRCVRTFFADANDAVMCVGSAR